MRKAVVMGVTSGIGRSIAEMPLRGGWSLCTACRPSSTGAGTSSPEFERFSVKKRREA